MKTQRYILHKNDPSRANVEARLHSFVARLPAGQSWAVEIKPYSQSRTLKQNRALFGLAYDVLCEFAGYEGARERERLHEHMCGEFFGWRQDRLLGAVPIRTTTTDATGARDVIDRKTMAEFYAFLQRKGAEIGCDIPDPDPLHVDPADGP